VKISYNWLSELVDLGGLDAQTLAARLTLSGLEVEAVERIGDNPGLSSVVVGHIQTIEPHPNADKLVVCQVDAGEGRQRQIVCGAKNMKAGDKVPVALPGTNMPGGFAIKVAKLRGVQSEGMLCSARELEIGEDDDGLMLLPQELPTGRPLLEALQTADTILHVSVTPNRPDALSHVGVSRDVAALTGRALRWPTQAHAWKLGEAGTLPASAPEGLDVFVEDAEGCWRYAALVIEGVKVGPSPLWLKNRLSALGQRSINNLVDVTNYVMLECGQPLHAFDLDKLQGGRLGARRAAEGEVIETLDGTSRALTPADLVIADGQGPVAIAGVMGGAGSSVSEQTTRVALEGACFNPSWVRRTARRLGMHSESSHRFERGVDPNGVPHFLSRAWDLIQRLCPEARLVAAADRYPAPKAPREVLLPLARYGEVIGAQPSAQVMLDTLASLHIPATLDGELLRVQAPTFRPDIERPIDVIEEVARILGFEAVEATLPLGQLGFAHQTRPDAQGLSETLVSHEDERAVRQAREALLGRGLREAVTYNFTDSRLLSALGFAQDDVRARPIKVRNPLSEEVDVMRTSLMPGLLTALKHNRAHRVSGANLFEVGRVYLRDDLADAPLPEAVGGPRWNHHAEPTQLGVILADAAWEHHSGAKRWDLSDARAMAEEVVALVARQSVELAPLSPSPGMLHPFASAALLVEGVVVGWIGGLHPDLLSSLEVEGEVYGFELDLTRLLALRQGLGRMSPLPRHPASQRDFALLLDATTPYAAVEAALKAFGDARVEGWRLFDVYEGERLGAGKKSMAISVTLRGLEATLSEEELTGLHHALSEHLKGKLGAELR
jgi:phenylalanyl-tRNA synthetase beta chain